MKQVSRAKTRFELVPERTRTRVFLDEVNLVVPWAELVGLIQCRPPLTEVVGSDVYLD